MVTNVENFSKVASDVTNYIALVEWNAYISLFYKKKLQFTF